MKLQSELSVMQEKYAVSLDELQIQRDELERLVARVRSQSAEIKELQTAGEQQEARRCAAEKQAKQLEYDMDIYKQEIGKQDKMIESIKSDWSTGIRNHEEEIKGYKQSYQILNDELAHTKRELAEFTGRISSLKQQASELSNGLEHKSVENEHLSTDLDKTQALCALQEAKLSECGAELAGARATIEHVQTALADANAKLADAERRCEQAAKNQEQQENLSKNLSDSLTELKKRVRPLFGVFSIVLG